MRLSLGEREREMRSVRDAKKLMDKHHSLKQDFDDLLRETEALKATLEKAKRKNSRLLAEVRFLRQRHKLLTSDSVAINIKESTSRPRNLEIPSDRKMSEEDGAASRRTISLLDLNKVSEEDCEDVQTVWEPLRFNEASVKSDAMGFDPPNDLKLPIWRDISNGIGSTEVAERAGKRKISWKDQVALKV